MKPLISFCSQCKGRRHHLELTLLNNLECIQKYPELDYVLVDFDSDDGLLEWISKFQCYLDTGILKYYRVENQPLYLQSAAKNLSHRLSTGTNIINVDADNYLTDEYIEAALTEINKNENTILLTSLTDIDATYPKLMEVYLGTYGRIGMPRKIFDKVEGYDELFEYWGGEDTDIIARLRNYIKQNKELGYREVKISVDIMGDKIDHTNESRFEFCDPKILKENLDPELMQRNLIITDIELPDIVKETHHKKVEESKEKNLIVSRKFGTKFDVQQLVDGKLVYVGNI